MTEVADLQEQIESERAARGFTTDPVRIMTLLSEELGEVAREVKKTWSPNYEAFDAARLAPELADVFVLLNALASTCEIDLETAVRDKFFGSDAQRHWPSAERPTAPS